MYDFILSLLIIFVQQFVKQQKMFKNNYLQLYKSSSSQHINPNILVTHFHHIYSTLGCVLQDLQYQIGQLVLQNTQFSQIIQKDERYKNMEMKKNDRGSKGRQSRQVKQMERRSGKSQERQQYSRKTKQRQDKEIKNKYIVQKQKIKLEDSMANKQQQSSDFLNFLLYQDKIKQKPISFYPPQKMKNYANKNVNDRSQQTFKEDKMENKFLKPQKIGFQVKKQQNSGKKFEAEYSYDDFMDKIFEDAENRKSK